MARTQNMTEGRPLKLIFALAIPLMLGNVFQQLYTVMDTLIVGRTLGVDSLAALGSTDWVVWLILGIVTGFTQGFSILMAQDYGAGNICHLKKGIAHSIALSAFWSVTLTILSLIAGKPLLRFLQTPEEILPMSVIYMYIIFLGIPVIMAYNLLAAILRALGDGRTPLIAMIIASVINIILDLVFIITFKMGVAGAALGTVCAQLTAGLICFSALRKTEFLKLSKEDFALESTLINKLMYLGVPVAFQNMVIAVGGMVLQFVVNGFGVLFIAGYTAANKLYGILEMAAISYGYAMITYVGQNLGAGKYMRIKKGVHTGVLAGIVTSLIISAVMLIFGRTIVGAFITGTPNEIAQTCEIAFRYLAIMSIFLSTLYLLHVYRSALQGMGNTVMPMVSGIAEFVMRVGAAITLPALIGGDGIFIAEVLAWTGADVILITSYYIILKKILRKENTTDYAV